MKSIFIISLIVTAYFSVAQDVIYKKDNSKITAKILEINQTEIKYKLFTYQDGPIITISKTEIALIEYQNGTHEVINVQQEPIVTNYNSNYPFIGNDDFKTLTKNKNLISYNSLELLNGTFGVSYFREFANNRLNIFFPVSAGFTTPVLNQNINYGNNNINGTYIDNYNFSRKVIEVGLGLNFQTTTNTAITHFIGPYLSMAQYNGYFNEKVYSTPPNMGGIATNIEHAFVMNRSYFMLNNGFLCRISEKFNIIVNLAFGIRTDSYVSNSPNLYSNNTYNNYPGGISAFKLGLHFGYRF